MKRAGSGSGQREHGRGAPRLAVFLLPFLLAGGCAGGGPEPLRLTLISPHRDEIRQEVALAFRDWFRARTDQRVAAARSALGHWLEESETAAAVTRPFQDLFADWTDSDLPGLSAAFLTWERVPNHEHAQDLLAALDQWHSRQGPVDLVWQDIGGGTSQIARFIKARYEDRPQGIGIDLLFGGGTENYLDFAERGLLQKIEIPAPLLSRIRPELNGVPLYDPGGRWYGPVLSSFGILTNRGVLERIGEAGPRHWSDLGRPGLLGWVSAGDPRLSGSVHMVYEIILQGPLGWDGGMRLLLRLGANARSFVRDSGTLTRQVGSGEVAAAGTVDVQALGAVARDPALMSFQLPPGETLINPDAVAVLKGAPRPQLARAFVEFLLSDAGQCLFFLRPGVPGGPRRDALCRLSVVEELYARYPPAERSVGAANPFTAGNTIPYDSKRGNRRWAALNDLFGAWVVDPHPELSAAWCAVVHGKKGLGERGRLEEELFRPPCTEPELAAYARRITEDSPRERIRQLTRWGEEARARYRSVRRQATDG
jgi:ABC-type Fe3+ transport system substrate-binding protein